jgi:Fic family protein
MKNFKSGTYVNQGYYKSFEPAPLCREWQINDMSISALLSKADQFIGRLDMYSEHVDISLFTQMHVAKEAMMSSLIEGTRTNMEDAFLDKDDVHVEKRDDWEELNNYIAAMNETIGLLPKLPFSVRLIKKAHEILLRGVRGEEKMPGEFRRSQNWIGGISINDAIFVPPVHASVPGLLSDLEIFANNENDNIPDLVKIAMIHYQFETIHPFLDGNGRTGRLIIALYLVSKGVLKNPILYLSSFFEKHKTLYYDNLTRTRVNNDMGQWIKFFLSGVAETSRKGVETLNAVMQLKQSIDKQTSKYGRRAEDAMMVMDHLYKKPAISPVEVARIINKSPQTAYNLITRLERDNILKPVSMARRNKIYLFEPYFNLFSYL